MHSSGRSVQNNPLHVLPGHGQWDACHLGRTLEAIQMAVQLVQVAVHKECGVKNAVAPALHQLLRYYLAWAAELQSQSDGANLQNVTLLFSCAYVYVVYGASSRAPIPAANQFSRAGGWCFLVCYHLVM